MRVLRSLVQHGLYQAGLTNARLTGHHDGLAFSGNGLAPSLQDKCQLLVAPDHRRRTVGLMCLEPAFRYMWGEVPQSC